MDGYIVVHPGGAHLDEVLAAGLICATHGAMPVVRRQPTDDELASPDVWVVDVGLVHDPQRRDFDHHQDDPVVHDDCALSLVARHLGLHELLSTRPWYPAQITVDLRGHDELARRHGIGRTMPEELLSPVETALLALWRGGGEGPVDPALVAMATALAAALIDEAHGYHDELAAARPRADVRELGGVPVLVVEMRLRDEVAERLRADWQAEHGRTIPLSVTRDTRNPEGLSLSRFEDDPRVDLYRLRDDPRIAFAHRQGFVAKTRGRLDDDELAELIARALTAAPA